MELNSPRMVNGGKTAKEVRFESHLRPKDFSEFPGQKKLRKN